MIYLILLQALLASTFSIGKILLENMSPILLIGARMTIAGIGMLAYQYIKNRHALRIKKDALLPLAQVSIFGIYLSFILEFWGMNYVPSFKTCAIFALSPFITYIIACLLYGEKTKLLKWVGMAVGFIGIMPTLLAESSSEEALGSLLMLSWADIAILLAAILYSYGWFPVDTLVREKNYSSFTINGYAMFFAGIAALCSAPYLETIAIGSLSKIAIYLPLLILIGNIICYNLYAYLLRRFSPTIIAFASLLTPLFGALCGWLFLHEVITWHFYVSFALVTLAFAIFFYDELAVTRQRNQP